MNFSQSTVILFTVTLDSTGSDPVILASIALPQRSNGADIPFDTLCEQPPARRGALVIALTFSSYYTLGGRNLTPQWHFHSACGSFFLLGVALSLSVGLQRGFPEIKLQCHSGSEVELEHFLAAVTRLPWWIAHSVTWNRTHKIGPRKRGISFFWCPASEKQTVVTAVPASFHTKAPERSKEEGEKEGVWAQGKRQSKLLTGSHDNREETDKGLPRKNG